METDWKHALTSQGLLGMTRNWERQEAAFWGDLALLTP